MIEERPTAILGPHLRHVVHEHDSAQRSRPPGARDSTGVEVAAELGLRLVALDLAKHGLPAFRR
jgi:hypothetical protein